MDVEALLQPVSEEQPCGPDLEYDADMLALEQAGRGKPEQEFGDTIIPAQEPDWREVAALAEPLLVRSKDLRVAAHWTRANTKMKGFAGFAAGVALTRGLLDRYWEQVYPLLDADDGNDPTMRLNALAPLADSDGLLRDLRRAPLSAHGGAAALRLRDVELALNAAEPGPDESAPTEEGVLNGLAELVQADNDLPGRVRSAAADVEAIDKFIDQYSTGVAPDLGELRRLLRLVMGIIERATGSADSGGEGSGNDSVGGAVAGAAGGAVAVGNIRTREDAIRVLDSVCLWLAKNEPTNPAPLLIRRAQRLMRKDFIEIIKDLMPSGLDQLMQVVGQEIESE